MKHEIKVWPQFFKAIWCGDKTFEIRSDDRRYSERDEVVLQEFDPDLPEAEAYSGREVDAFITYLTDFKQRNGNVVFSFRETGRRE